MSRSENSRKGAREGNYKCRCCKPRVVKIRWADEAAVREGRTPGDYGPRDNDFKKHICDWD